MISNIVLMLSNLIKTGNETLDIIIISLAITIAPSIISRLKCTRKLINFFYRNKISITIHNKCIKTSSDRQIVTMNLSSDALDKVNLIKALEIYLSGLIANQKYGNTHIYFISNNISYKLPNKFKLYDIGIGINVNEHNNFSEDGTKLIKETTIELYSLNPNKTTLVDIKKFTTKIYNDYMHELTNNKPTERYFLHNANFDINCHFIPLDAIAFKYVGRELDAFNKIIFKDSNIIKEDINKFVEGTSKRKFLNFLAHGPPGTGKTSFIKSLAEYTDRNIINICLDKTITNKTLYTILNAKKLCGMERNDNIYVFEDIDRMNSCINKENTENINLEDKDDIDKLTLNTILNILDGICIPPGRIVVFTTNHIEKLDDAFYRSERMTHNIHFDNIPWSIAKNLIKIYLDDTIDVDSIPNNLFNKDCKFNPAFIKNLCLKSQATYDSVINQLKNKHN